jgi:hypothetical protein
MAWAEVWSIQVDGHELNDLTNYVTQIPEIEDLPADDIILVPIDGAPPAYIRSQPKEAIYSILLSMKPCNWATYQAHMASLRSILPKGVPLTLQVQIRGMSSPMSTIIIVRSWAVNAKQRSIAVTTVAPVPLFAAS